MIEILERKVYSSWAFSANEDEKARINSELYEELKDKAEIEHVGVSYGSSIYVVISNPCQLSDDELALIADEGNLCFGYRSEGNRIIIYTD